MRSNSFEIETTGKKEGTEKLRRGEPATGMVGGGGRAREISLSFYYIVSGRGEADAQLFMPVSRPIGRIGIRSPNTYHICAEIECARERRVMRAARTAPLLPSNPPPPLFLRSD